MATNEDNIQVVSTARRKNEHGMRHVINTGNG
jgi:hypothetical protein